MARADGTLPDLALARGSLDRRAELRERPGLLAGLLADPTTRVLELVTGRAAVTRDDAGQPKLVFRTPVAQDEGRLAFFLGAEPGCGDDENGRQAAYVAVVVPDGDPALDRASTRESLRSVGARLGARDAGVFTTALALANWHGRHTHCPRCGTATEAVLAGWTRRCPADGSEHYPRTDPAVIMSVVDDAGRVLLARGAGFASRGMSVLAGFVEPGETLAAAVEREVREEVGVAVTDVTYLGDQPWPFPSSLMVGFTCRALTTELTLQDGEIEHARWFSREELIAATAAGEVAISGRLSIARRIIEHWYGAPIDAPEHPIARPRA